MTDKNKVENNEVPSDKSRFVAELADMKITTVEEMRKRAAEKDAEDKKNS